MPTDPSTEDRTSLRDKLRVWSYAPRAMAMVWRASPAATVGKLSLHLMSSLFPLAGLWATKLIIDSAAAGDEAAYLYVGLFGVAAWLNAACGRLGTGLAVYMESRIPTYATTLLQERVTSLQGIALYEDARFHDALENAERGARNGGILNMLGSLVVQGCVLAVSAVLMGRYHPLAPAVVFVTAIPRVVLDYRFLAREWTIQRSGAPEARRMEYCSEVVTGDEHAKEVRLFGLGPTFIDAYWKAFRTVYDKIQSVRVRRSAWHVAGAFVAAAGAGSVYAYLALLAGTGQLTPGDLVLYTGLLFSLHTQMLLFNNAVTNSYRGLLDLSMLFGFLDRDEDLPLLKSGKERRVPRPIEQGLVLEEVSFAYPGVDAPALDRVSFQIPAGQTVALVGANGSGKTTLVKLLTRLYDPTAGRILLDGVELRDYDVTDLRRSLAVVLQDFVRYHLPVRDNLGFGQLGRMADDEALWGAAERGQARQVIERLPEGLDTVLGREFPEGLELSGGEWQRLAISRGFLRDGELLILDEPTAALDARAEQALYERFAELVRGRTALFISHRLATVRMADHIVVLDDGRVVEEGNHEALMAHDGRYAHLFTLQAERYES